MPFYYLTFECKYAFENNLNDLRPIKYQLNKLILILLFGVTGYLHISLNVCKASKSFPSCCFFSVSCKDINLWTCI